MSEALLRGLHNFFASDVAEDEKVRERIAAEAVAAMNAARDFARGEESRNGLPVLVENARFLIDLEAAHRVMDRNRDGHAVVGSTGQPITAFGTESAESDWSFAASL